MPTYDYVCPANGEVLEVEHKLAEKLTTWGELCQRTGREPGATPRATPITRLITGGHVLRAGALGSQQERPCDTSPCAARACGGGACGF
ncbi:MAG: zinc ribbon domain-containing protein [Proteobacteria bacterium]|nr:zinc ribbon domain-containing protein [Pseudomonadota bacterium]